MILVAFASPVKIGKQILERLQYLVHIGADSINIMQRITEDGVNMHIPRNLRIRSEGTERHSA